MHPKHEGWTRLPYGPSNLMVIFPKVHQVHSLSYPVSILSFLIKNAKSFINKSIRLDDPIISVIFYDPKDQRKEDKTG